MSDVLTRQPGAPGEAGEPNPITDHVGGGYKEHEKVELGNLAPEEAQGIGAVAIDADNSGHDEPHKAFLSAVSEHSNPSQLDLPTSSPGTKGAEGQHPSDEVMDLNTGKPFGQPYKKQ